MGRPRRRCTCVLACVLGGVIGQAWGETRQRKNVAESKFRWKQVARLTSHSSANRGAISIRRPTAAATRMRINGLQVGTAAASVLGVAAFSPSAAGCAAAPAAALPAHAALGALRGAHVQCPPQPGVCPAWAAPGGGGGGGGGAAGSPCRWPWASRPEHHHAVAPGAHAAEEEPPAWLWHLQPRTASASGAGADLLSVVADGGGVVRGNSPWHGSSIRKRQAGQVRSSVGEAVSPNHGRWRLRRHRGKCELRPLRALLLPLARKARSLCSLQQSVPQPLR